MSSPASARNRRWRAVAGRHAPPARRPAAPARHRQEGGHLCRHRARPRPRGRAAHAALRARRLQQHDHQCRRAHRSRAERARPHRRHRATQSSPPRSSRQNVESNGSTIAQIAAYSSLGEILGLLNTQVGDRYLFSGRAADQPAVESIEHIMNGDGARAGFKQIVAERRQADLGAERPRPPRHLGADRDLGAASRKTSRLPVRLQARRHQLELDQSTVTGPAGAPAAMTVDLGAALRTRARPSSSASTCRTARARP